MASSQYFLEQSSTIVWFCRERQRKQQLGGSSFCANNQSAEYLCPCFPIGECPKLVQTSRSTLRIFFQMIVLSSKGCLTQRAPDLGYAPRFFGISLALADSRFEGESTLPPQAGNASRWAPGRNYRGLARRHEELLQLAGTPRAVT